MTNLDDIERLLRVATPRPWSIDGSTIRYRDLSDNMLREPDYDSRDEDGELIELLVNNAEALVAVARAAQVVAKAARQAPEGMKGSGIWWTKATTDAVVAMVKTVEEVE